MEKIINNRFRELKTISESAMGNVCIAYDTRDEQNIALKFLCHEFHKDEEMLTRFRLEFNTLMKLRHSNLASVFEFGTSEDGLPFFTMEFIDGEQINKLDFELKKVYSCLKQICTAIRYIHSHGIIHGDIKSSNILVTKTGNVKILDFGLAQRINEFEANSISGTIEYLPPEVLKGQAVSFQTDLYSFGVVLYEILTNELPYKNDDLFSEFFGKLTNPIKSPTEKNKIIPQELSNVVLKLIERDASGRYQTINEVIEDLNKFLTEKIPYEEQNTFYALNKHFVSRKDQLNTLKIIHSGAKTGTGKSVLLVGKNGIGKTRLLKEFEFFTSLGEGKVVYQNFPENTEPGFKTWLPILKKCFDKFATKEEINEFGKIFVKFLPELAELYQLPLQNFQTKEQLEFFNSLVEFFFRISRNKTFLLILDDVQFASPTNLKLLDFLVKKCTKTCVMICFATSDETQFHTVFNENIIKLEISGFNFSETATFIASKLGLKGEPIEFGKRLFEETNGSLLYIEECIRYLVSEKIVYREGEMWKTKFKDYKQISFPKTFEELVVLRFNSLDKRKKEILHFCSCLENSFKLSILKEFSNLSLETIIDILDELVSNDFLSRKVVNTGIDYSFLHDEIKNIVKKQLPLEKSYKTIANFLEKNVAEANLLLLANLFAFIENWGKALKFYSLSAEFLREVACFDEAAKVYQIYFDNYTKYEYSNDKKIIFHAIELGKLYNSLGNFELASQILNKAIELSKNSDNELLLCEAFLNQAFCLQNKNEFETALKLLENAKNIAKSLSAKKQLGEIEFRIANVLIKENNFLPSIDHLILSKEIAKENGANELILSSKLLLAQSFFTQNNFAETQKILKNLFELDFKEDFPVLLSNAYTLFGNLNFSLNKFELALESFEKTLKILRKFGSLETNSTTLYKIGKINFYLCNYENAFASFEESLLLAEQCGNITTQIEIFTEIGELYRLTGNFKKSLDYLNKAISGLEKAPSDKLKAQIYHNLGKLFAELGNPLEALNFYDKSIVLSDSNNYHDLCSSNRIGIARVSRFQKEQTEITLSKIEEALRIANEFGCLFEETIALYELGELYLEQKQNDVALENFQKSIAIAERIRLDFYIAKNYLKMGFVYINEENFNRAVLCLDGAQKVFTHLPLGRLQLEIFYFEIYFAKQQKQFYKALSVCEAAIKTVEKMADTLEDTKNREKYLSGFEELYRERFLFFLKANEQEKLYQKFRNLKIKNWAETYEKYREKVLKGIIEVEEEHQNTTEPIKISLNAEHYLAKLLQISQTLNVIRNEEKLLQTTLDLLIETVGAEKGVIFLKDEQTGELLPKATGKSEFETVQDAFQISQTVLEDVVSGGKPIVSLNAKNDNRYKQKQSIVKYQITSFICVPLSFDGKIIGTVYVDKRGNEQALNNDDLNFIVGFASQAAIAIENARLTAKLKTENQNLKAIVSEKFHFEGIIGNSKPMQKIFEKLTKVIESDSTVVVSGESGTGKELIAKAIHFNGARKDKPFIAVNCSELPETLENELFGHRKGSFTGAVFDKKGLFEEASGGTIFLDEITNTSLGFQAKLLRVLQEREVRRIGETVPRKIDVRVIAATNIDLFQATKEGGFREDLYYRLNVIQINLPQLSKREGDVETLVNFFLEKNSKRRGKNYKISHKALKMLVSYDFPGNVRQLENLIEQAVVMCNNETIEESDLPELNPSLQQKKSGFSTYNLNEIEKQIISEVLKKCNWEFKKTAQTLGISRTTLYSKVEKHNLQRN